MSKSCGQGSADAVKQVAAGTRKSASPTRGRYSCAGTTIPTKLVAIVMPSRARDLRAQRIGLRSRKTSKVRSLPTRIQCRSKLFDAYAKAATSMRAGTWLVAAPIRYGTADDAVRRSIGHHVGERFAKSAAPKQVLALSTRTLARSLRHGIIASDSIIKSNPTFVRRLSPDNARSRPIANPQRRRDHEQASPRIDADVAAGETKISHPDGTAASS